VATNPPVHWFREPDAEQPPPVGGLVGGVVGDVVGSVVGPSDSVGVDQSRQSARLPAARLEILITPGALPVFSRNFWMFCCNGVRHSGRTAQWLPSWMSDQ
jgi:hypothetical protein